MRRTRSGDARFGPLPCPVSPSRPSFSPRPPSCWGTLASTWLQPRAPESAPPSFALPSAPVPSVPIPPKEVALDLDPWTAGGTPPPQPLLGNAPRVDVARLDADGRLTLGGRAVPGDRVRVALDGVERDAVPTDAQGVWVDLGTVLPDRTRAVLTVTAEDGNGVRHDGQQRVSLARAGTEAVILAEEAGAARACGRACKRGSDRPGSVSTR